MSVGLSDGLKSLHCFHDFLAKLFQPNHMRLFSCVYELVFYKTDKIVFYLFLSHFSENRFGFFIHNTTKLWSEKYDGRTTVSKYFLFPVSVM